MVDAFGDDKGYHHMPEKFPASGRDINFSLIKELKAGVNSTCQSS